MKTKNWFTKEGLIAALPWFFAFLGILAYLVGFGLPFLIDYTSASVYSIISNVAIKIGDIFIIGVILELITTSDLFLSFFGDSLNKVLYADDFLNNRKDLPKIWENISKLMFKKKFPEIHDEFLQIIKSYFPTEEVSFYRNMDIQLTLEWIDEAKGIVKCTEDRTFYLVAETKSSFPYHLKTWTKVKKGDTYKADIIKFTVNREAIRFNRQTEEQNGDDVIKTTTYILKGKYEYKIHSIIAKEYNFNDDYYIGLRSNYIVKNLKVALTCPDNIDATFVCRGTPLEFESVESVKSSKKTTKKEYEGILLPRQGYIFALRKKEKGSI